MEIMNCKSCRRLFNYVTGPQLCPACRDEQEKKFIEVKEFIRANPGKNIAEVSEEMDVSIQQLKRWVRQERLIFSEDSGVMIECENCGASIRTGRFCEACKKKMSNALGELYKQEEQTVKRRHVDDKMRHL